MTLLDKQGQKLYDIIGSNNIEKHPELPVFEIHQKRIFTKRDDIHHRRQNLLREILKEFSQVFLQYNENPVDDNLSGYWQKYGRQIWLIPQDVDINELYNWLYLGNWFFYVLHKGQKFDQTNEQLVNFQNQLKMLEFMKENSISFLLSAFHDNDPWFVAVNSID